MCLSVFAQIGRIASPFIHFLVGGRTSAIGWLLMAVGALWFFMWCLCLSVSSPIWVPAAESGLSFQYTPLFLYIYGRGCSQGYKGFFFFLIHWRLTELTEDYKQVSLCSGQLWRSQMLGNNIFTWLLIIIRKVNFLLPELFFNNQLKEHI